MTIAVIRRTNTGEGAAHRRIDRAGPGIICAAGPGPAVAGTLVRRFLRRWARGANAASRPEPRRLAS